MRGWEKKGKTSEIKERTKLSHLISSNLSLNCEGRWGTKDDFTTSFLHFSLFSTALWDLANSRPVSSLTLSSHLISYLSCFLPPFTVPCKMVLARLDERPYHCSLHLFTMVRRSLCGRIACLILARTSSFVTFSLSLMKCVVSCGSTLFPWLVFFGALL